MTIIASMSRDKVVLVTDGMGSLGSAFARAAAEAGAQVVFVGWRTGLAEATFGAFGRVDAVGDSAVPLRQPDARR